VTTNIELAKEIARYVQLEMVLLRRADIVADFDPYEAPSEMELIQGYRCGYDAADHPETGRISISIDLKFAAKRMDEGGDAVTLEATFLLIYLIDKTKELNETCLEHFANVNGPYNAWPYWRELVQSATGRVGLGGITVPVFRPMETQVQDELGAAESPM
jgi:hypothetical protein